MAPELSESQYTAYIARRTSRVVHRTSPVVHRTTFIVAWFPELYESVLKWSAADYTDQAETMPVHDIAQPPELSESRDKLYVVHRPSYIARRTSYIARRTSHLVHRTSYVVHRCTLSQLNGSAIDCTD